MKKWLLSKLLLLLGLSSFAQVFQSGNTSSGLLLNDTPDLLIGQVQTSLNNLPPVAGAIHPELATALQTTLDSLRTEYGSVGLSAALIIPNGDIWKGTSGVNNVFGDTLSTEMRIGMGSVTKTFTGAVVMQLVEENMLNLDDSLHQWLPSYPNVDSSITVRQLLNHTSGIYNYTDNPVFGAFLDQNLDSIFEATFLLENFVAAPTFTPGATWGYSNTNYLLLGLIIETVTGNTYQEEVRNRLLDPFDHSTMSLHPNEMPTGDIAHLWLDLTGDGIPNDYTGAGGSLNGLFSMAWAAGALLTTPEDLAHWIKNLMTGQVVSQGALDQMMETVPLAPNAGYGLSLTNIQTGAANWWGHNGGIGYLTNAYYSPELDLSLVLMSNSSPFDELDEVFFTLIQTYLEFMPTAAGESFFEANNLMVYPNPFSNDLIIAIDLENPAPLHLTITNQVGQLVYQRKYDRLSAGMNNLRLTDCGHWPAGIYQVKLEGEDWMVVDKILKE